MQTSTRRYANPYEVQLVRWLIEADLNNCQISRAIGISVPAIREWRHRPAEWPRVRRIQGRIARHLCPRCHDRGLDERAYAYLLGQYLGDGHIVLMRPGVYRLRITMTATYRQMIGECCRAIGAVRSGGCRPLLQEEQGCVDVSAYWKHWLIHSDGWRGTNPIVRRYRTSGGEIIRRYEYPRYLFTNHSDDIRKIFTEACDLYGIHWRQSRWNTISIARKADVQKLDRVIGLKV